MCINYFINWKFRRIPLLDSFKVPITDSDSNVRAFVSNNAARRSTHVASTNAANFLDSHFGPSYSVVESSPSKKTCKLTRIE